MLQTLLPKEECRCGGNCDTCLDVVGADPEVWCPYCTVHASQEEWDAARTVQTLIPKEVAE